MFFYKKTIFFLTIFSMLTNTAFAEEETCSVTKTSKLKAIVKSYTQGFITVDNAVSESCEVQISGIRDKKLDAKALYPFKNSHYVCNALGQSFRHQYATEIKICDISTDANPKYRVISVKDVSTLLDW